MTRKELLLFLEWLGDNWWFIPIFIIVLGFGIWLAAYVLSCIDYQIEAEREYKKEVLKTLEELKEKSKEDD